ncbi:MAG: hypothetical protein RJQ08_03770 [Salinisphaeraceae bacterium]
MTIEPRDLVAREVHYGISSLISTLANGYGRGFSDGNGDLAELCEQAFELSTPLADYDDAADDATGRWSRDECVDYLEALSIECRDDESIATLREAVIVNAREEGLEEFCNVHDIEPHDREVYEHWLVSDWLADMLEAKGEKVDKDFAGLTVWARTTTGQAIYMDGVIQDICRDLNDRHADDPS